MSTRFVIVGAARTGSTMLVRTLDGLAGVRCHGELLNPDGVRGYADGFDAFAATPQERKARADQLDGARSADPAAFVRDALAGDAAVNGFKALYSAFLDPHWSPAIDDLRGDPGVKFVHLVRHNELRRYVSEQILHSGGTNHSAVGGRSNRSVRVTVDIDAFCRSRDATRDERERARQLMAGHDVLEVGYEDMSGQPGEVIAGICAFLGVVVDPAAIEPALRKVGASDLRESVHNYDELLAHEATRDFILGS